MSTAKRRGSGEVAENISSSIALSNICIGAMRSSMALKQASKTISLFPFPACFGCSDLWVFSTGEGIPLHGGHFQI